MPVNPFIKGGSDIPVTDGGTGASDAGTARTNLGALDGASHNALNHAGLPGVGDLTTAAHGALDHSTISGVGRAILHWHGFVNNTATPVPVVDANAATSRPMPVAGTIETLARGLGGGSTQSYQVVVSTGGSLTTGLLANGGTAAINLAFPAGASISINTGSGAGGSSFHDVGISVSF